MRHRRSSRLRLDGAEQPLGCVGHYISVLTALSNLCDFARLPLAEHCVSVLTALSNLCDPERVSPHALISTRLRLNGAGQPLGLQI
jgi:hypothetical protein